MIGVANTFEPPHDHVQVFRFGIYQIRTIEWTGGRWYAAKDVCAAIGLSNTSHALARLRTSEKADMRLGRTSERSSLIVSEPGMLRLVLTGSKAAAGQFEDWVRTEVMPVPFKATEAVAPAAAEASSSPPPALPSIMAFAFESHQVRVTDQNGDPWFVLADVCSVLEIANSRDAASRLDDEEKGVVTTDTLGGPQATTIVNESGLWSLVLTSRKEAAKRFKKWVTAEVIPSIRKTGSYGQRDPLEMLNDPAAMRGILLGYTEKVIALQSKVAELAPKAEALDAIAKADGSLCITDAAKALQIRPKALFAKLQAERWIYRRPGGAGYLGYQPKVQSGDVEHKVDIVQRADGSDAIREQVRITAKGLTKLAASI